MNSALTTGRRLEGADLRLVRTLHADPRASVSALAKAVNESRSLVSVRLRNLIASGAIRIVGVVNPGFMGQHLIAQVSISTRGSVADVARLAVERDEIVFASAILGVHDFVVEARVATQEDLHSLLTRFRDEPSVTDLSTVMDARVIRGSIAHDTFEPIDIDAVDLALIKLLQDDGRATYQALATGVGLSPSAVRARLQRLLDSRLVKVGVIEARGLHGAKMSMGVGFTLGADGGVVSRFLRDADFVEFAAETLGAYDAIATIAADAPGQLFEHLEVLRQLPGVNHTTSWVHLRTVKEDYRRRVPARDS
jgi:DNA-binding Lrp family transcriptional regulator